MYKEKIEKLLKNIKESDNKKEEISLIENGCAIIFEYPAVVAFSEARECVAKVEYNINTKEYEEISKKIENQRIDAHKAALDMMNKINTLCEIMKVEKCFNGSVGRIFTYSSAKDRHRTEKIASDMLKEFKNIAEDRILNAEFGQKPMEIDRFSK